MTAGGMARARPSFGESLGPRHSCWREWWVTFPRSWWAPTPPGYVGAHLANARLAGLRPIGIGHEFGPEHTAIGPNVCSTAHAKRAKQRPAADGRGEPLHRRSGCSTRDHASRSR
jgi:hypothetical protein